MFRKIHLLGLLAFCLGDFAAAQERKPINLKECSYLYTGYGLNDAKPEQGAFTGGRVIYALKDSIHREMTKMIVDAINGYWDAGIQHATMEIDQTSAMFRQYPKFKPKLPKNYSDKWELFFRIVDKEYQLVPFLNMQTTGYAGNYVFECKVLNGADGSEVFSRSMEVVMEFGFKPDGCYILKNIPGLPATFLEGFNEAIKTFFSTSAPPVYTTTLKPACLFIDLATASQIKRTIRFERSGNTLQVVEGPDIGWSPKPMEREKSSKTKRKGSGIGSGLVALAGLDNTKERSKTTKFITRINMEDKSTGVLYGFYIPIEETTTEEVTTVQTKSNGSSSYEKEVGPAQVSRKIDGTAQILRGSDTIGWFNIQQTPTGKSPDNLNYMWDGKDSASIKPMPGHWNTSGPYNLMSIKGQLYGKEILFTNSKGGNQLDVWYDNLHVATFKTEDYLPREGILYNVEIPDEVLKVLGMLTSLPFGYYM
ncbi:MAG: hypothetical protein MUE71_09905 [Chitinophagaceae bacterium]|nr:hypothetical protein [Chitinophagaceae bacterium]